VTIVSRPIKVIDGLSLEMPDAGLRPYLERGPTPAGPSFTMSRRAVHIARAEAGSNEDQVVKSFDDDETTEWASDGKMANGWIKYDFAQPAQVSEVTMKLTGWRTQSYPIRILVDGKVVFAGVNKYGRPPLQVAHGGGAYISQTIEYGSNDQRKLLDINRRLIRALGMHTGATHAEFIRSEVDNEFYFLEIAARVGGAYIADVLEAATGINLWREWARLEVDGVNPRKRLRPRKEHAGIILSLARQEYPDTSAYDDREIVYRVKKKHHAGLIVRAEKRERVTELLNDYARRFADDFVAVLPPMERPE